MRTVWVVGGSVVAVVAVATAVIVGTDAGRGTTPAASARPTLSVTQPSAVSETSALAASAPGTSTPATTSVPKTPKTPKPVDVSKLFEYAAVTSAYGQGDASDDKLRTRLPLAAAREAMMVLRGIDPTLAHVRALKAAATAVDIVADGSEPDLNQESLSSAWTADGVTPYENTYTRSGNVEVYFGDSHAMLGAPGAPPLRNPPCGIVPADLGLVLADNPNASWTACSVRTLADGSTVSTSTSARGPGTIMFAVREFPGGRGGIVVLANDFPMIDPPAGQELDAAHVLSPSPWTEQSLAEALSAPDLTPAL